MAIPVKLEVFEGPLDLLLHLIEKNKIDIYDIPIVLITEQYLAYIESMHINDMDVLSEFLVMAANLIRIKSKMLLPPEEDEEDAEISDPRTELVERLLEYKMYKYASYELKGRQVEASKVLYKSQDMPDEVTYYEEEVDTEELLSGVTMKQLQSLFESILRRREDKVDPVRSKFGKIEKYEITVEDKMEELRSLINGKKDISFRSLLGEAKNIRHVIVSFLAILELMKMGALFASQNQPFDDIILTGKE